MCDQQSLRPACAYAQPDQSLCLSLEYSMIVKLLTERHLEFLSITGGCRGPSESTLVKMSNCWKSRALAHIICWSQKHALLYGYVSLICFIYFSGFFILIGVFVFLGFYSTLDKTLEADGSLGFPFAMCLLAGLVAIAAAVITGFALGKHLLEWEEDDDDEDDGLPYSQGVEGKRASVDIWEPTRREVPGEKEWAESLEADASRL